MAKSHDMNAKPNGKVRLSKPFTPINSKILSLILIINIS